MWPQEAQVYFAIQLMKPGTAPGEDSIPAKFFTLFMSPDSEAGDLGAPRDSDSPQTPMGRALFQLLASVWESGVIFESCQWQSSESVVVPLEQGGDSDVHDVGNFRGISLLSVALENQWKYSARSWVSTYQPVVCCGGAWGASSTRRASGLSQKGGVYGPGYFANDSD
jgi:hypothetical protein